MRSRKKKPLTWETVIKYKKEICLAMAVAGITDEEGKVKDRQTFRKNGGSENPYRWHSPVQDILDYSNTEDLPVVWPRLIAEYAKPFIDGLTKRDAPKLRAEYISKFYSKRHQQIKIEQKFREMLKRRTARGDASFADLYRGGDYYDVRKHPIFQQHYYYITYLRKRLQDPEFAKNFVDKYVLLPKSNNVRQLAADRLYIQHPLAVKMQGIMNKYGAIMFGNTFPLDILCSNRPLAFGRGNFYHFVEKKAIKRKLYKVPDEFRLVKYRNKLYIILY